MSEYVVMTFRKRCPPFVNDTVLCHDFSRFHFLVERMRFHLIDHGNGFDAEYFTVGEHEVGEPCACEVRYTNRLHLTGFIKLNECLPGTKDVSIRLVQKIEIKILKPELLQRRLIGLLRFFVGSIRNPKLARHKYLVPGHATVLYASAYCFFILIGR